MNLSITRRTRLMVQATTLAMLCAAVTGVTAGPATASPVEVDATLVPVGGAPTNVAIDSQRDVAYVSITENDEIAVVNLATNTVASFHVMNEPAGIAMSTDNKYLYVALHADGAVARIDLDNWTSETAALPAMLDHRAWDVVEVSPGVVAVAANPGTSAFAYMVTYNFNTGVETRIANARQYRADPELAVDQAGEYMYVSEDHWPQSLSKFDLATPLIDRVAQDTHGDLNRTVRYDISPDGTRIATLSGQIVETTNITEVATVAAGVPLYSPSGDLLYTIDHTMFDDGIGISVSAAATSTLLEQWKPACDDGEPFSVYPRASWAPNGTDMIVTMPNSICVIDTLDAIPPPMPPGGRFFDDDGNIHEASIEAIAAQGITKGCNPPYQTGYCPSTPVTREQMAAFLVRALGLTDTGDGNGFTDDDASIFEGDITRLAAANITKGCNPPSNTLFCPTDVVTRGQMAAFLTRAMGYQRSNVSLFDDAAGSVFEPDINALAMAGVTKGCNPPNNTRYCPDEPVTRAQMATFLTRALDLPVLAVPERPATTKGEDLHVMQDATARGCAMVHDGVCRISDAVNGEFFLLTGWYIENWSSYTATEQAAFRSDKLRHEATLDGLPIDLVEWPFEVIDNVGYKTVTYQFPGWLSGSHVLDVVFVDDHDPLRWTIRDDIVASGPGFSLSSAAPQPANGQADRLLVSPTRDAFLKSPTVDFQTK